MYKNYIHWDVWRWKLYAKAERKNYTAQWVIIYIDIIFNITSVLQQWYTDLTCLFFCVFIYTYIYSTNRLYVHTTIYVVKYFGGKSPGKSGVDDHNDWIHKSFISLLFSLANFLFNTQSVNVFYAKTNTNLQKFYSYIHTVLYLHIHMCLCVCVTYIYHLFDCNQLDALTTWST